MIGVGSVKKIVFDHKKVMGKARDATRRVFQKFGQAVKNTARRSIVKNKGTSTSGNPPFSHTGWLKRWMDKDFDSRTRSEVIGPVPLHKITFGTDLSSRVSVPELLEYGGQAGVVEKAFRVGGEGPVVWARRDLRRMGARALLAALRENKKRGFAIDAGGGNFVVPTTHHRFRTYTIAARPYMRPAFEKEKPGLPAMWRDSIK